MAGKQRYQEFAIFPMYEHAYRRAFEKMLLIRKQEGRDDRNDRWADADAVFRWWMEESYIPGQYEMLLNEETNELYY